MITDLLHSAPQANNYHLSTINYQLNLVSIMIRLVRAVYRYTDISSLFRSQLSQFHPDFFKMQTGYFLIQMFRQTLYIYIIFFIEQFDLS